MNEQVKTDGIQLGKVHDDVADGQILDYDPMHHSLLRCPSMPSLPFPRLPQLAQAKIIKSLSLKDVIVLSSCSQKTCLMVNASTYKVAKVNWKIEKDYFKISITRNDSESIHIHFLFSTGSMARYDLILNTIKLSVNAKNMLITHYKDNVPFEKISEFVLNAFRIQKHSLETDIDFFPTTSPMWKLFENAENLTVGGKMGSEDVRRILEDVKTSGTLHLKFKTEEGWKYSEGLKHEDVKIKEPTWLDFNAVLSSESRYINLEVYRPTNGQLAAFIQKWTSGSGLLNLSMLSMTLPDEQDVTDEDCNEIFEGVYIYEWRGDGRPREVVFENKTIRICLDGAIGMKRKTDGKMAAFGTWGNKVIFLDAEQVII